MASHQEQIAELRILIKENRFDEARELLENLDHPKAQEWLRQLEARETAYKAAAGAHSRQLAKSSSQLKVNAKAAPQPAAEPTAVAKAGITFMRVLVGSVVGFGVVLAAMIFLDRQFAIHEYFLDDSNRRVLTLAVGFALFSTAVFGFIARLIGGASNFFIGLYYALLAVVMLAIWQFISVYYLQGADAALGHPLSAQSMDSYREFLNTIPLETMLAYGASVVISIGVAYFLGATSDEELQRRARSRSR
ncbi:MAG: hypothetical protein U0694_03045 [Anaerolineae bacterium]